MSKNALRQEQEVFDAETTVEDAATWAEALVQRSYQGPGDTIEAAQYRAEAKYGVPAQTFWALRYRKPKHILASIYLKLKHAYQAECERQETRLRHELEMTKKVLGNAAVTDGLVAEAEAFLETAHEPKRG